MVSICVCVCVCVRGGGGGGGGGLEAKLYMWGCSKNFQCTL